MHTQPENLFPDLPQVLSPRMAWMRRNGVTVEKLPDEPERWVAEWHGIRLTGESEEAAIGRMASWLLNNHGIQSWHTSPPEA